MKKLTAAIIGCGSIGALKNSQYDTPIEPEQGCVHNVLTQAHAFYDHPSVELRGFIDHDYEKAIQAGQKWRSYTWRDMDSMVAHVDAPDIISVCTPTETHRDVLMSLLEYHPKLVIAEKPFCSTLKEAEEVHAAYLAAGIPILVDYIRRFDNVQHRVFEELKSGSYGTIYHARCLYGRGLKRDGCHGLDIFNWIFGESGGLLFNHKGIVDHLPFDPSFTLRLEYDKCHEVYMVATDSRAWGCFEMDFITEKGVIRFVDWGKELHIYSPEMETTYGQYRALGKSSFRMQTELPFALLNMADNAVKHLSIGEELRCTSADAINVHRILHHIGGKQK